MKKRVLVAIGVLSLCLIGCGGSSAKSAAYDNVGAAEPMMTAEAAAPAAEPMMNDTEGLGVDEAAYSAEESNSEVNSAPETSESTDEKVDIKESGDSMLVESKIVYTANMGIQTKEYDKTVRSIKNLMKKYGGVIQSESQTDENYDWYRTDNVKTSGTMHGDFSIRIPSKHFEDFVEDLNGYGKIISKDIHADNISQQYYDNKIKIKSLEKQEARLYEMMDSAVEIKDILEIEQRLTEVDDRLLSLKTEIKYMDTNVAYSTINMHVDEVVEFTEKEEPIRTDTFADRLRAVCIGTWEGLLKFAEGLLFLIIRLLPTIIIVGIILFVTVPIIKKKRLLNKFKKPQVTEEKTENIEE